MSQESDRDQIKQLIVGYIKKDPEFAPHIVDACSLGVGLALREEREKSADLECALCALATNKKSEWAHDVLRQKLEKWKDRLALRWDWFLDRMKKAA